MKTENESAQVSHFAEAVREVASDAGKAIVPAAILWLGSLPTTPPFITGKFNRVSGLVALGLFAGELVLNTAANAIDKYNGNTPK